MGMHASQAKIAHSCTEWSRWELKKLHGTGDIFRKGMHELSSCTEVPPEA